MSHPWGVSSWAPTRRWLQSLSKFFWRDFGCLGIGSHWVTFHERWSLKSFAYFCRWNLLSRCLLLKNVRKPVEAICSHFAETLNYELCLWLTNMLILLRFKILALSPSPLQVKFSCTSLPYKFGWILDMWLVLVYSTSVPVFIFCNAFIKGHFTAFISALPEIQ